MTDNVLTGPVSIPLSDVIRISEPTKYKVHLARSNGQTRPLDVFVRSRAEWDEWHRWRSYRDDFNRDFIFALMDFHPEPDIWLFGGIYEVLSRSDEDHAHSYEVALSESCAAFIGRLKIHLHRPGRARVVQFENYLDRMSVSEILRRPYSG